MHRIAAPSKSFLGNSKGNTGLYGIAAHCGGLAAADAAGAQAASGGLGPGGVGGPAGNDLAVGHLRHGGGGLPPDVPHRPGGL